MPYERPTPAELRDRVAAEFDVLFVGADPRRRRSVEGVMTRVLALVSHEMHGHIGWAARQMHIATCDLDAVPERAAVWGITRNDAVAAWGPLTMSGTQGVVIPAGAELRRADNAIYAVVADTAIGVGGTAVGQVRAVTPGAAGNAAAGTALALIEPIAGVQSNAVVAAGGLGGGLDIEGLGSLRARALQRIQQPPAGGATHDYEAWVKAAVGETRVWVRPYTPAPGWVSVMFLMPDGSIPSSGTVADVAAAIEARRPVTATGVQVVAPVAHLVPFTIALTPDTLVTRMAVEAEIDDLFRREAVPGGTLPLSRIAAAISAAAGEDSHVMSSPSGAIVSAPGQIARRGAMTWL
ncbi:baseplate J/gp47 family protein [Roseomonas terrae]|uniref:Baseplate J/gp47 family protein n=1 Tax=Neoroseomonas terrae TaxID=424799 RepID=A0ABS5EQK2_9PROT|nr:baseplate J/gp47 family protein [Neoroseomonas terrae]MBR0653305.1 baseplate J/gp47 family protein [Neoroseomonas terrae]